MKILCVCRNGMNRSRYMAEYLKTQGYETKFSGSDLHAANPTTQDMINWADVIITAREVHEKLIRERFNVRAKVIALDVHNDGYHSQTMHEQVEQQLAPHLPL